MIEERFSFLPLPSPRLEPGQSTVNLACFSKDAFYVFAWMLFPMSSCDELDVAQTSLEHAWNEFHGMCAL